MYGRLAVDTNAVIAYRDGIPIVCILIEEADILFFACCRSGRTALRVT